MPARKLALAVGLVVTLMIALTPIVLRPGTYATVQSTTQLQTNTVNGESSISVDPHDSNYLIDSWPSQWFTPSYSQDGGASWHNGTKNPTGTWTTGIATGDPWTAIGPDGTDYFTTYYNNTQDLVAYMATSTDHGKTWSVDLNYFASAANNSATVWTLLNGTTTTGCYSSDLHFVGDQEKIAVDSGASSPYRGYVYIVGDFGVNQDGICAIQDGIVRSTDGGKTWDLHLITSPTTLASETEQLAIGRNGGIYFARFYNDSDVIFERSADGGPTWSYQFVAVSNLEAFTVNIGISVDGVLDIVYMRCLSTCSPSSNGKSAVFLTSSTNNGHSWSSPTQISDDSALPYWTFVPVVCGQFTDCEAEHRPPTITTSSLGTVVAWTDWRNSNNNTNADIYAYVPGTTSNTRLTRFPGRLCNLPKTIACTWNGNDFLSSASSQEGVYLAFGIDFDGNTPSRGNFIDAVVVVITGTSSGCTIVATETFQNSPLCLLVFPLVTVAAAISAASIFVLTVRKRRRKLGATKQFPVAASLSP
jgi:hypothetical protein